MKSKKVFKVGDKVFFLKDRKETLYGTEIQFHSVSDGVITYKEDEDDYYVIKRNCLPTVNMDSSKMFASYKEAEEKAKELNNKNLSELERIVDWIKGFYPL